MEMKRHELIEIYQSLDNVRQKGSKFCYAITKNKRKLKQEIQDMEQAIKPSAEYRKFIDEMEALKRELSKKDEKGNPVLIQKRGPDGNFITFYDIPDVGSPDSEFAKRTQKITDKYDKYIKEHDAKVKDYRENLLQELVDFKFHKIVLEDVPEDISQEEMDAIYNFISNGEDKDE